MSFFDIFKATRYKNELMELRSMLTPDLQNAIDLKREISNLEATLKQKTAESEKQINKLDTEISSRNNEIMNLVSTIEEMKKSIINLDDEILVQEFGLYKPTFNFASALDYREKLSEIRSKQKDMIKEKTAVSGDTNWTVNNSSSQGRKMVNDMTKLLLRAFNSDCDDIVSKVKYTNFDASIDRIYKSSEAIAKLGTVLGISVSSKYLDLKVKELRLAFEYQIKKQEEKEALRAAREEQREQAKIQRELEEQRRKIEKEQSHYETALEKLEAQIANDPNNLDLQKKLADIKNQLSDIELSLNNIDYRQANMRAGYVYIISNIGSFGENVYKIGMTRRLDPQERIDELGDASVPFRFDIHAMIFSDDAPALESALHRAFENKKLNMVNQRREFFNVTLDEIKSVIKSNFDKTVEFIDVADAEQYRISQKMHTSRSY